MWDRWQRGETLHSIARSFDRYHTSVWGILAATGGIRPPERRRSQLALTLAEREQISSAMVAGHSICSIAMSLGRAPSTVSREIKRNGGRERYRASQAGQAAWDRARRPKSCKLVVNRALARLVAKQPGRCCSPGQIADWLKWTYPNDERCQVSYETIYKSLFIQARGR
jgi:IS30 family transposase